MNATFDTVAPGIDIRASRRKVGRPLLGIVTAVAIVAVWLSVSGSASAAGDYRDANYRVISAPDCVDASQMITELGPAPLDTTYMRVQHIGDPGTDELLGEVRNIVTWDVGQVTGLSLSRALDPLAQRGYRNIGPPNAASAFQLWCNAAGFYINTRRFSHTSPLMLAGPSVSVARDFEPGLSIFTNATSSLTIDANVSVPVAQYDSPPVVEGTIQVSFFYYARDVTSGTVFAHVIALFDNRAPGVNGAGSEAVSADAYTAFIASPLLPTTHEGAATQYVTISPLSATEQFVSPWSGPKYFRAHVPYGKFRAMLLRLKQQSLPAISVRPEDYRVTLFGLLGEVFPGTGRDHEVALGASVTDLALSEAYYEVPATRVVEFFNPALDHYFISARSADIEAIDSGRLAGWMRTGEGFNANPTFVAGTRPVCRYYLPPQVGDSHFLSASESECLEVAARFPAFVLEDSEVMYMAMPDPITGSCPAGFIGVYRLWNNRIDSNHRYTTNARTRNVMLARGYVAEGYGPEAVAMCAPAS